MSASINFVKDATSAASNHWESIASMDDIRAEIAILAKQEVSSAYYSTTIVTNQNFCLQLHYTNTQHLQLQWQSSNTSLHYTHSITSSLSLSLKTN